MNYKSHKIVAPLVFSEKTQFPGTGVREATLDRATQLFASVPKHLPTEQKLASQHASILCIVSIVCIHSAVSHHHYRRGATISPPSFKNLGRIKHDQTALARFG